MENGWKANDDLYINISLSAGSVLTTRLVSFRADRYSFVKFESSLNNKLKNISAVHENVSWKEN